MNELQAFQHPQFGILRTIEKDGEPWFLVMDVCTSLCLLNPTMVAGRLDADERAKFNIGRQGEANFVSFPGLLSLVLGSRKPEAREYKRWVTHEVLPSVHRHGGYVVGQEHMTPEEHALATMQYFASVVEDQKRQLAEQQRVIEVQAPKVAFANSVLASSDCILMREQARFMQQQGLNIGEKRLYALLRADGYLCSHGSSWNLPTQRAMDLGLFEVEESTYTNPTTGNQMLSRTTKVTAKGQQYFLRRYLSERPA